MDEIQLRVACKALIVRDGKVLIIRESGQYDEGTNEGKYDVPGGRVTPGEQFAESLRREVREEVGLDATVGRPVLVAEWRPVVRGTQLQIVGIYFACQAAGDVALGQDHDDYRWIGPEEVRGYRFMYSVDDAILAYFGSTEA